jgi:hypothetical protein
MRTAFSRQLSAVGQKGNKDTKRIAQWGKMKPRLNMNTEKVTGESSWTETDSLKVRKTVTSVSIPRAPEYRDHSWTMAGEASGAGR